MTTNFDRAAEVIHDTVQEWPQDDVAGVAARRLADAGLLAPDLPEFDDQDLVGVDDFGHIFVRYAVDDQWLALDDARALADALYAAANHAEKENSHADA